MVLPLVVNAEDISDADLAGVKILDCRLKDDYEVGHLPGALLIEPSLLNRSDAPTGGLLPDAEGIAALIDAIGLQPGDHILTYDNGGETAAARCIWVLHAYGFTATSWLNGGFPAWEKTGRGCSAEMIPSSSTQLKLQPVDGIALDVESVMQGLDGFTFLDTRSAAEYEGTDVRAARGGHVPGARHWNWIDVFDADDKLLPDETLRAMLAERDVNKDDHAVVYCQTHQRSAVTYLVLKHLGFDKVSAIDGAWSAWGNREDTPIET